MRYLTGCFDPTKEDLSKATVWIQLYSLYYSSGNALGIYIKCLEVTGVSGYTSYAHFYFLSNILNPLPESTILDYQYYEWVQTKSFGWAKVSM